MATTNEKGCSTLLRCILLVAMQSMFIQHLIHFVYTSSSGEEVGGGGSRDSRRKKRLAAACLAAPLLI